MRRRWLKFGGVGVLGVAVQLASLALYANVLGLSYLPATALAVESAVLHNFVWHERWTWQGRGAGAWRRLLRFHVANGVASIVSNVLLMRVLAGACGVPILPANLISIGVTSFANFLLSEYFVFAE